MAYKFLNHTADIKFEATGKDLEEAFIESGYALMNIFCKQKIKSLIKKEFIINGKDKENLLYNFLEEFLFLIDTEGLMLGSVQRIEITKVSEKKYELKAIVFCDKVKNYEIQSHVKAITYNDMIIKQEKENFRIQIVVDV